MARVLVAFVVLALAVQLSGCPPADDDDLSTAWLTTGNEGATHPGLYLGTADDTPLMLGVGDDQALRLDPGGADGTGTPVVVGGHASNGGPVGLAGGAIRGGGQTSLPNSVVDDFCTVGGGTGNKAGGGDAGLADASYATSRGGALATADAWASASAGQFAHAQGGYSTILGGHYVTATGWSSVVGGGYSNAVAGMLSVVLGGTDNGSSGWNDSVVGGGSLNAVEAGSSFCTIGGGESNRASGAAATIAGGVKNTALADLATVGGGSRNRAEAYGVTILGGSDNRPASQAPAADLAAIGGGGGNIVGGLHATIVGGVDNLVLGRSSAVGGGYDNGTRYGEWAAIAGGGENRVDGAGASVGGGESNWAGWVEWPADYTVVPGGNNNTALGRLVFAAGRWAGFDPWFLGQQPGCFLWRDSTYPPQGGPYLRCDNPDAFRVKASGGIVLYSSFDPELGVSLGPGEKEWSEVSDRAVKKDIVEVVPGEVLRGVLETPVFRWRYRTSSAGTRHLGPMAQDFHAAFGLGRDERSIARLDPGGVNIAGIQALWEEVAEMERVIAARKAGGHRSGSRSGGGSGPLAGLLDWFLAGTTLVWVAGAGLLGFFLGGLRRRGRREGRELCEGASPRAATMVPGLALLVAAAVILHATGATAQPCWDVYGNRGTDPSVNFVGTTDETEFVLRVNGNPAFRFLPGGTDGLGTPNLVGGSSVNGVDPGVAGATIGGGGDKPDAGNHALDDFCSIGGGSENVAGDGVETANEGTHASVCGGRGNTAGGTAAAICGGEANVAGGEHSVVGGGIGNAAAGDASVVAGGSGNSAPADHSTVGGGWENEADGESGTVCGGSWNGVFGGKNGTVCGGFANDAAADYATVGGGSHNIAAEAGATVCGGDGNLAAGYRSTVGGGYGNTAIGRWATVIGGESCHAAADRATVAGGLNNRADNEYAAVGGGANNAATGPYSTVAGGGSNLADEEGATVGGGVENRALGRFSTVPGGFHNVANGAYSFAAGSYTDARYDGCFVWGDSSTEAVVDCEQPDQFVARASGGFEFFTNNLMDRGVRLPPGEGQWQEISDRDAKRDIVPVDPDDVLRKLVEVPIYTWSYKTSATGARHMGPMAQDFYAAFGLGGSDKTMTALDAAGVTMAAIQGLHRRVEVLRAELDSLDRQQAAADRADGAPVETRRAGAPQNLVVLLLCGLGLGVGAVIRRARDSRARQR